jgi:hypothetical protein
MLVVCGVAFEMGQGTLPLILSLFPSRASLFLQDLKFPQFLPGLGQNWGPRKLVREDGRIPRPGILPHVDFYSLLSCIIFWQLLPPTSRNF